MPEFSAIHRSLASTIRQGCKVGAIALPILFSATQVQAEGSRDLTSSGGYRPYLEYRTASAGGVPRKTIIKVYAEVGETINLGSSAVGVGNGIIRYTRPNGSTGNCGGIGLIANRAAELNPSFTPCTITVGNGEAGIWEIDFVSPNPGSATNPNARLATNSWTQPDDVGYISAWDVTVRNNGSPVNGRVYANYYAFNIGNNVSNALSSSMVVLTQEGYRYEVDFNGLDPYGFILFSNNKGYRDSTGDPIFRSLQYVGENPGNLPGGFSFQDPNTPDSLNDVTHKLFINPPDSSMPGFASSPAGSTWLYSDPSPPPQPNNFAFVGDEGTNGQAGTNPLGGQFTFDYSGFNDNSYSITLDIGGNPDGSPDGIFGNANDVTLLGLASPGFNQVAWDGRDGRGNPVAAGDNSYGAQINLYAGEAHFPMADAENNPNGIIIERLNQPAGYPSTGRFQVFYDDRNSGFSGTDFSLCASGETGADCYGTGPNPRAALTGVNSSGGAHRFNGTFGDRRGIDTWVYYPSTTVILNGGITIKEADLVLLKTDNTETAKPGDSLTYVITIENQGPSNVVNATFSDDLPTELTNATWTCAITNGTGNCGADSGTADGDNRISTALDLQKDAIATYHITTQVSALPPSGSITNTGTVKRPDDVTDPDETNNSDGDTTTITTPTNRPNVLLVKRITAINGQPVSLDGGDLSMYTDEATNPYDDNIQEIPAPQTSGGPQPDTTHWPNPNSFLIGGIDGGNVRPGDELEYSIYFLSTGELDAEDVVFCDRVPENVTFTPTAFNSGFPADPNGIINSDHGILLNQNGTSLSLSNVADGDRGHYFPPNSPLTDLYPQLSNCGINDNGAVVVELQTLPTATGPGTPIGASGFVRFRGQVK